MANRVPTTPPGFHTVTPALVVKDADKAIAFYKQAFAAEEIMCMRSPEGRVMHAELMIGDSPIMLGGEWPDMGMKAPLPNHYSGGLHVYGTDVDKAYQRAINAGCTPVMPPTDMFWGDRYAKVLDPFGHQWGLATHIEEVSPEECARRAAAWKPGSCS
ncbi:MAG TPA: VOC family protein [Phycisphaerae bacterium]|nr:VOC family protein [Phycisphaerae bacterium]HNU46445.1 VOC family protein [Phycisphaerae bacterium]